MPLLVPEQELVPGEEQWHASLCTGCGGGCGTLVRVMEGERITADKNEPVRERVAAIKKIEGNPLDPVSGGRLCARGQAAVQSLYHPDRLRGPMQRTGDRGGAHFSPVTWDAALTAAADKLNQARTADPSKIAFLTTTGSGSRAAALASFARALKVAPPVVCSITDHAIEREAAAMVFGWHGQPLYDLANADFALGVGADLLGGWTSPVYYARQFGQFRQGRKGLRGRLAQAESRMSITAAAADTWLPVKPGTEAQFVVAVGKLLLDGNLARGAGLLPAPVAAAFRSAKVDQLLAACGLPEKRVRDVVEELGHAKAPLVIAGASVVQANSLDAIVASHYLNIMLGNVGKPGGVLPPAAQPETAAASHNVAVALKNPRVIVIDGANPAYLFPASSGIPEALKKADAVISLGSFLDDSTAWADLILPGHDALESELAVVPAVAAGRSVTASAPFIRPLYDTRAVEKTLADLAAKMEMKWEQAGAREFIAPFAAGDLTVDEIFRQGGAWSSPASSGQPPRVNVVKFETGAAGSTATPVAGEPFPLVFQAYPSLQFHDGSASHLPWMQELPDPVSSSIWGLPVEMDPKTAATLQIANGDVVRVESAHGMIDAPAYVHPAAIPGVVSMAIGDGHTHFSRYASARGANPLSVLAPVFEKSTGVLVMGGTRVKLTRVGGHKSWIQFSTPDREERDAHR